MFIGQEIQKKELLLLAKEIYARNHQNILILGSSGYGKTTLAMNLIKYCGLSYSISIGDSNINFNAEILLLDEAHLIKKPEKLYPYMDSHTKSLLFLTTEMGALPEPLINRCYKIILRDYTEIELLTIAEFYAKNSRKKFTIPMLKVITDRSRGIPREIENMIKRIILHTKSGEFYWTLEHLQLLLDSLGVYEGGFTYFDTQYIDFLGKVGGTASLVTIMNGIKQSKETITSYIEPFLIRKGMIKITSKGRQLINE